jgi:putative membrane protein
MNRRTHRSRKIVRAVSIAVPTTAPDASPDSILDSAPPHSDGLTESVADQQHRGIAMPEPDYRFTLANERTFLAWQRTSLGQLAAAVALIDFGPVMVVPRTQHIIEVLLALLAALTAGAGFTRWKRADFAIRRNLPLSRPRTFYVLGSSFVGLGLFVSECVVAKAVTG